MSTTGPSAHLTWAELGCKDGTAYPLEWRDDRAILIAAEFEAVRAMSGWLPLSVISAFRTPTHNRKVGGARNSQHLHGRALDLRPPAGMRVGQFHQIVLRSAAHPGSRVRGVGKYQTFVHIDIRASDRLVRWAGAGVKDDR